MSEIEGSVNRIGIPQITMHSYGRGDNFECSCNEPIFTFEDCRTAGVGEDMRRRQLWRYAPKPTKPWTEWSPPSL